MIITFDITDVGAHVILKTEAEVISTMHPRAAVFWLSFIGKIVAITDEDDPESDYYFTLEVIKSANIASGKILTFPRFLFEKANKKVENILNGVNE